MPPGPFGHGRGRRDQRPPSSPLRRGRISRSLMNRVAAIQKSSRTITTAWTCSPSQCRRAATSSVFSSPRLAWSHCSNWSRTSSTLRSGGKMRPLRKFRQRIDQPQSSGQFRTDLAQALEQPGFRLLRGRLDVDRKDVLAQPGQESRLDQRRLAAARGTVDQPHLESQVGVDLLDLSLPESDAVRQSVPVPRSGKQFQEEVGIMLIEGSQPLRDDLDRSLVGVGLPGSGREWSASRVDPGGGLMGTAGASRRDRASCGLEEQAKVFRHVLGGACSGRSPASTTPSGRSVPVPWGSCRRSGGEGEASVVAIRSSNSLRASSLS